MKYYGKTKKNNGFMMIFGLIVAGVSFYSGITQFGSSKSWIFIICGILFLIVSFYKTIQVVTEEGADEIGSFFGMKRHNVWKWEDCNYMFGDYRKIAPDVMVVVRSGNKNRNYVLERSCIPQVFDWAARANPNMKIEYYGVGEEEFADTELAKNRAKEGRTESVELRHVAEDFKNAKAEAKAAEAAAAARVARAEELAAYKRPRPGSMKFKKMNRKLKSIR
ncbi:MAG: hypothetical protein ACOX4R_00985 [Lentihominibacter sp.]|jgi:hypothetical protein